MSEQMTEDNSAIDNSADNLTQDTLAENEMQQEGDTGESNPETPRQVNTYSNEFVHKLQAEVEDVKDKHLRLIAEFDNFRRRTAKEAMDVRLTASKDMMQALLVVLDDMSRAEKQLDATDDVAAIKEGVALVFNKLRTVLHNKGLKLMETNASEFDADLHEAITEIPAPSPDRVGKIIDVVEPGYYLNDKLIRHAKVVVGK